MKLTVTVKYKLNAKDYQTHSSRMDVKFRDAKEKDIQFICTYKKKRFFLYDGMYWTNLYDYGPVNNDIVKFSREAINGTLFPLGILSGDQQTFAKRYAVEHYKKFLVSETHVYVRAEEPCYVVLHSNNHLEVAVMHDHIPAGVRRFSVHQYKEAVAMANLLGSIAYDKPRQPILPQTKLETVASEGNSYIIRERK